MKHCAGEGETGNNPSRDELVEPKTAGRVQKHRNARIAAILNPENSPSKQPHYKGSR